MPTEVMARPPDVSSMPKPQEPQEVYSVMIEGTGVDPLTQTYNRNEFDLHLTERLSRVPGEGQTNLDIDSLTHLPSRQQFEKVVNRTIETEPGRAAIAFIELLDLKAANDNSINGHSQGDLLLTQASGALRHFVEEGAKDPSLIKRLITEYHTMGLTEDNAVAVIREMTKSVGIYARTKGSGFGIEFEGPIQNPALYAGIIKTAMSYQNGVRTTVGVTNHEVGESAKSLYERAGQELAKDETDQILAAINSSGDLEATHLNDLVALLDHMRNRFGDRSWSIKKCAKIAKEEYLRLLTLSQQQAGTSDKALSVESQKMEERHLKGPTVAILDVNDLSDANAISGERGDEMLRTVGGALQYLQGIGRELGNTPEKQDLLGMLERNGIPQDEARKVIHSISLVSRTGGDEFGVIAEGAADGEILAHVLRTVVKEYNSSGISVAVGTASYIDGESEQELLNRADQRMFEAKDQQIATEFDNLSVEQRMEVKKIISLVWEIAADIRRRHPNESVESAIGTAAKFARIKQEQDQLAPAA